MRFRGSPDGGRSHSDSDLSHGSSGQPITVPKKGTLIIKMKDGTTQEFDLATVDSVDVLDQ